MIKIIKKIFKAGNYGTKGNYSIESLRKWVEDGKEFSVIPGHIQDWIKSGYAKTAIPIGGKVKCSSVDEEGFLYGEIEYNEFGKKVTEGGAYENFSIGISPGGAPDHLALLGYAPPHIKELDKAFSEFAGEVGEAEYIEFAEGNPEPEPKAEISLEQIIEFLTNLDATEDNRGAFEKINGIIWKKQDQGFWAEKLKEEGYTVEKEFAASKTEEEIRAEITAEITRDSERKALKSKVMAIVPPSMKGLMEFAVDQAFEGGNYEEIIEFSEEEKYPMRSHLEKMAEEGGPFKHLFTEFSKGIEGAGLNKVNTTDEIIANAKKLMMEV